MRPGAGRPPRPVGRLSVASSWTSVSGGAGCRSKTDCRAIRAATGGRLRLRCRRVAAPRTAHVPTPWSAGDMRQRAPVRPEPDRLALQLGQIRGLLRVPGIRRVLLHLGGLPGRAGDVEPGRGLWSSMRSPTAGASCPVRSRVGPSGPDSISYRDRRCRERLHRVADPHDPVSRDAVYRDIKTLKY